MKFYLTKPTYEVTIRDFGGGWFSGNCIKGNDLDKVRKAGLKNYMESTAHEGGYFYITKIQYINGDKVNAYVKGYKTKKEIFELD